jgi:hypothetical protein
MACRIVKRFNVSSFYHVMNTFLNARSLMYPGSQLWGMGVWGMGVYFDMLSCHIDR